MIAADALLNAANAGNINAVREFKKPDSSYIREYNKFKNHITLLSLMKATNFSRDKMLICTSP